MMTLAVISDTIWQALIAAAVTIVLAYMSSRTRKAVDSNHADTVGKVESLQTVAQATHSLINSGAMVDLSLHRAMSHRLAEITGDPKDVAAAAALDQKVKEHIAAQDRVDALPGTDAAKRGVVETKGTL